MGYVLIGSGSWIAGNFVAPAAPNITTTVLPTGTVGAFYYSNLTATGTTPITWSVTSGNSTLTTANLTLTSGGLLSGTPANNVTGFVTFQATNSVGNANTTLSLTVSNAVVNSITLSLPTGTATNYPFQFGRVFKQGVIANYPQVLVGGSAQTTQADVKNRWPDGSVKFAVISCIIPSLSTSNTTITFQNQASSNSTPVTVSSMLSAYDFNCTINATVSNVALTGAPISARTILNALSDATLASNTANSSVNSQYWTQGPICTTVILCDHTSKTYDFGLDSYKVLRPIFHVQFWPTINKYKVRVIVECSDTTKIKDQIYDVSLSTGNTSPTTVYTRSAIPHALGTRWTKSFWSGTAPVDINAFHNSEYLSDCRVMPRYDPTNVPSESQNASAISGWNSTAQDIYDAGYWAKGMQGPGARAEIALFPEWSVLSLTTGDYRRKAIDVKSAELALAWPMNFREGDSAKVYNSDSASRNIGRALTIYSRPSLTFNNDNLYISGWQGSGPYSQYANTQDIFGFIPAPSSSSLNGAGTNNNGWQPFWDHAPDNFTPLYLTTGDYLWLEQMQFWASHAAFDPNPTGDGFYGRGATYTSGNLSGDIRRLAWMFRSRVAAANWSTDGSLEKSYFTYLTNNAIAIQEGMQGITGGAYQSLYAADYAWGQTTGRVGRYGAALSGVGVGPLHYGDQVGFYNGFFNEYIGYNSSTGGSNLIGAQQSVYQMGYLLLALTYASDLGFESNKLVEWYSYYITEATKSADTAWLVTISKAPLQYGTATPSSASVTRTGWIPSWSGVLDCFLDKSYTPNLVPSNPAFPGTVGTPQYRGLNEYASLGSTNVVNAAAAAMLQGRGLANASTAWDFFKTNFVDIRPTFVAAYFPFNPGWAIIPRP